MRKPFRLRPLWVASLMFAAVLGSASPGWAWIDTGHKVVAFIAWEDLTPAARAAVGAILKAHPRYEKDLLSGGTLEPVPADATAGLTPAELDRRAFAAAAVWPDLIKAPAHPLRIRQGHSNWHFIDLPYVEPTTQPAAAPEEPAVGKGAAPTNIVEALNLSVAQLRDPATPADQRAIAVCWIAHLVGDIHQPLHCCSLFGPQFPKGDQGGNSEVVMKDVRFANTRRNLHFLWDSLPGDYASDDVDRFIATGLHNDAHYARSAYPQLATTDFMAWAKESQKLAIEDAYLNGHLDVAVGSFGDRTAPGVKVPGLPAGYMQRAEHVAMQQVALAGYRLADLLNGALDPAAKH